ncbi:hypothetical protein TURU_048623 [Turdus rufiventris]|nr:hypothetical protein TURU_048623 [Turdus rufiventris]
MENLDPHLSKNMENLDPHASKNMENLDLHPSQIHGKPRSASFLNPWKTWICILPKTIENLNPLPSKTMENLDPHPSKNMENLEDFFHGNSRISEQPLQSEPLEQLPLSSMTRHFPALEKSRIKPRNPGIPELGKTLLDYQILHLIPSSTSRNSLDSSRDGDSKPPWAAPAKA